MFVKTTFFCLSVLLSSVYSLPLDTSLLNNHNMAVVVLDSIKSQERRYFCVSSFFFLAPYVICGILVSQQGIEPGLWAVRAWSPNHWAAREFPIVSLYK